MSYKPIYRITIARLELVLNVLLQNGIVQTATLDIVFPREL